MEGSTRARIHICGGTSDDVRLTTRYDENDFAKALMGTLHETGHALYKRGLPAEWRLQPGGAAAGMAFHVRQTPCAAVHVCRPRALTALCRPVVRERFAR